MNHLDIGFDGIDPEYGTLLHLVQDFDDNEIKVMHSTY